MIPILKAKACPPFDTADFGKMKAERSAWDTIDSCEKVWAENSAKLYEAIRRFPEEDLATEIDLPFAPDLRQSFAAIMSYPYWNVCYHLGQVCFVQTLYGDMEMR